MLTRTHGGAVAQGVLYELPLRYKSGRHQEEKKRIAAEAASRVADGVAIGLTGGTTTTEVARAVIDRQRLTVVTNALNIASELAIRPNLKLVVTGGYARPESYELVGPLAEQALAGLNLDVVFLGVDGISPTAGITTHHEVEAHTNLALIERAPPRRRGDGQLQDRSRGVRADLPDRSRARGDHRRRGRSRSARRTPRGRRRRGDRVTDRRGTPRASAAPSSGPRPALRTRRAPRAARRGSPWIDVHNHLGRWLTSGWAAPDVAALLEVMDAANVAAIVNLDGMRGEELQANLDRYDRAHPGRFVTFAQVDWPR